MTSQYSKAKCNIVNMAYKIHNMPDSLYSSYILYHFISFTHSCIQEILNEYLLCVIDMIVSWTCLPINSEGEV